VSDLKASLKSSNETKKTKIRDEKSEVRRGLGLTLAAGLRRRRQKKVSNEVCLGLKAPCAPK